jgi:hypothetical protein
MTNVLRTPSSTATAIQQRTASGHFFDGTLPTGDSPLDASNALFKYAKQNAGGLFYWDTVEPLICSQIHVDLGASGDITVSIVNLNPTTKVILTGEEMIIESTTGVRFIALDEARFKTVLLPYQAIKLVTTSSGADQIAQVVASLERTYVR